ncbi:MAG: peptidylprolyl isomerase [Marinicella pacifica]
MKKQLIWIFPLMFISGTAGWYLAGVDWQSESPEIKAGVLAVVNDGVITEDDFITQMKLRGGQSAGQYQDMKQKQVLLRFLINQKLLMNEALAQGIDQDPLVQKIYRQTVVDKFLETSLNKHLANIKVSSAEAKDYFEQNKKKYNRPARRRGAMIFKKFSSALSQEDKQALKDELLAVKKEAAGLPAHQTHFGDLARVHSDDRSTMYQGGVMGWLIENPNRAYKWPEEVTRAVFNLSENGDISDVIETEKGYFLVRLVAAENIQETHYEQIADGIKQKLLTDKQTAAKKAFLANIENNARIEINEALLMAIQPLNSAPKNNDKQPPAMPVQAGVQP